ncbi:MAG: 16S rRNA (guanine(966)-N(2))-methyltransferase RsmD [Propionibacteriaceae bacterium]|nr:16S rRNA (guanine(966)-N(2))-methyltransferase RsmD [Propionibacteriaceae bacterium]
MRIIAGRAKGRRLATPKGRDTRPTTDRVREAVFSIVTAWAGGGGEAGLAGLSFLDLYAGSGAMALEAASRGAAPAVAVESSKAAAALIGRNAAAAGLALEVAARPVEQYLARTGRPFDVVWADPPYALPDEALAGVLDRLAHGGWLADEALVAVERSARGPGPVWPRALAGYDIRRFGETSVHLAVFSEG